MGGGHRRESLLSPRCYGEVREVLAIDASSLRIRFLARRKGLEPCSTVSSRVSVCPLAVSVLRAATLRRQVGRRSDRAPSAVTVLNGVMSGVTGDPTDASSDTLQSTPRDPQRHTAPAGRGGRTAPGGTARRRFALGSRLPPDGTCATPGPRPDPRPDPTPRARRSRRAPWSRREPASAARSTDRVACRRSRGAGSASGGAAAPACGTTGPSARRPPGNATTEGMQFHKDKVLHTQTQAPTQDSRR